MSAKVIGIGNPYRSDDAVGRIVAQQLKQRWPGPIDVEILDGEGTELMTAWSECEHVIVIDAVQVNGQPGKIYRFEAHRQPVPAKFFHYSTHAFSLAEAIAMSQTLDCLPKSLIVFGIEGAQFDMGSQLSPDVETIVPNVVNQLCAELKHLEQEEASRA